MLSPEHCSHLHQWGWRAQAVPQVFLLTSPALVTSADLAFISFHAIYLCNFKEFHLHSVPTGAGVVRLAKASSPPAVELQEKPDHRLGQGLKCFINTCSPQLLDVHKALAGFRVQPL